MKKRDNSAIANVLSHLHDQTYFIAAFHDELRSRLNDAAEIYLEDNDDDDEWQKAWETRENVCDVFVSLKSRFLVYAPFVVMCANVEKMISVMKCDPNVQTEVENLEQELMDEMSSTENYNLPTTFNALMAIPFTHVLRYYHFKYTFLAKSLFVIFVYVRLTILFFYTKGPNSNISSLQV